MATAPIPLILIVDDEPVVGRMVCEMLTRSGYSCLVFARPENALRYLSLPQNEVDLGIFDYSMPGMTGVDLALNARAMRPSLPVVLMSSYPLDGVEFRFLAKPFRPSELVWAVEAALAGDSK